MSSFEERAQAHGDDERRWSRRKRRLHDPGGLEVVFRATLAAFLLLGQLQPTLAVATNVIEQRQQQETTSLPTGQPASTRAQQHSSKPRSVQHDQGDLLRPEVLNQPQAWHRALPISARGQLAIFAQASSLLVQAPPNPSSAGGGQPHSSSSQQHLPKCPPAQLRAAHQRPQVARLEVLAVEGSSVRLNLAIVTQRATKWLDSSGGNHSPLQAPRPPLSTSSQSLLPLPRLQWTRGENGDPIEGLNVARGRFSSVQLASESQPEVLGQLLGEVAAQRNRSAAIDSATLHRFGAAATFGQQRPPLEINADLPAATGSFLLLPHVDVQQLEQLERNHAGWQRLAPQTRLAVSSALKMRSAQVERSGPNVDNFLANGQAIDWSKLATFVRSKLGLSDEQEESEASEGSHSMRDCHINAQPEVDSLMLLQFELSQLKLSDRGLYQLFACAPQQQLPAASSGLAQLAAANRECARGQLLASVMLHTIEDIPRLESRFGAQLLDQGGRLSIKCEASGFTLPQISWFLDGQLLSESSGSSTSRQDSDQLDGNEQSLRAGQLNLMANNLNQANNHRHHHQVAQQNINSNNLAQQQSVRIGDYVSQDNHVHSFVNVSNVRLSDAGSYRCQANNGLHQVEHEARVDVRGQASIWRPLAPNVSVLVGAAQLQLQCPYSGHPVGPIEWFFKPAASVPAGHSSHQPAQSAALLATSGFGNTLDPQATTFNGDLQRPHSADSNLRSLKRKKRRHSAGQDDQEEEEAAAIHGRAGDRHTLKSVSKFVMRDDFGQEALDEEEIEALLNGNEPAALPPRVSSATADEDDDPSSAPDPERDEWLSQASAMEQQQQQRNPSESDYPEPMPDYPVPVLWGGASHGDSQEVAEPDYSDLEMSYQQQRRRKRNSPVQPEVDLSGGEQSHWLKLPQSRRQQVHANGTLALHDVQLSDRGQYKCRVLPASSARADSQDTGHLQASWSNELHLNTLVAPVISPFGSSEALREGMRNFLTCSVIEGDAPIQLAWLKDGQLLASSGGETLHLDEASTSLGAELQPRIRVEQSNEFTSTLSFNRVEFRDNGNYTCMATNKAASVNYTAKMVVNVPPKWTKTPRDLSCVAGQNIVIDCQAEAHPSPRIWWEVGTSQTHANEPGSQQTQIVPHSPSAAQNANQLERAPNHYRTIISNSRIHILENASLVIREASKQDQGFYLCQAANNFGSLSALIRLTVNVGASFTSKYLVKYVKLNDRVELDCDPTGQAPITVTWFARQQAPAGNAQQSGAPPIGKQLNHTLQPASGYASLASLAGNQSSSLPLAGDVNKPEARRRLFSATIQTIEAPAGQLQAQEHQHAAAAAAVAGQQSASSQSNGKLIEIDSSMAFEILEAAAGQRGGGGQLVRLHVRQARRHHSGELICQAANEFGQEEKSIRLLVQEPPEMVRDLSALQVESRSISLAWLAPFNGNSPITSYTVEWAPLEQPSAQADQQQSPSERQWSRAIAQQPALTIGSLQPMTSYEIRVFAQNAIGRSSYALEVPQVPFVVSTSVEAPSAPPGDIRVVPMSSRALQVSWLPPPPPPQALAANRQVDNQRKSPIKGYYLGYKLTNSNDSYIFKTIPHVDGNPNTGSKHASGGQSTRHLPPGHELVLSSSPYHQTTPTSDPFSNGRTHSSYNSTTPGNSRVRVTIGDLKRNSRYAIIVQAFNSAGSGPQSDALEARTLLNDPPPAPALRVGVATYTSIELQWSFPPGQQLDENPASQLEIEAGDSLGNQMESSSEIASQRRAAANDKQQAMDQAGKGQSHNQIDGYHLYFRLAENLQQTGWLERRLAAGSHAIVPSSQLAATPGGGPAETASRLGQASDLTIVDSSNPFEAEADASTPLGKPADESSSRQQNKLLPWTKHHGVNATLANKNFRFLMEQLACGNLYQIYLVAYNSFGAGQPSQIVRAKTRGSPPIGPRKQQDFIQVNSTFVKLNLLAWLDGGCSIQNFEIKYKQLAGGRQEAISVLNAAAEASGQRQQANNGDSQLPTKPTIDDGWLLLSNNISPEQRSIELRDLRPESWYALWVTAESSAGKTELQYAFMTLDRLGQAPSESLEPLPTPSNGLQAPALFRSQTALGAAGSSFRSILFNFGSVGSSSGSQGNQLPISPLIMSACMCLILFATCALFLIRRYNNMISGHHNGQKADESSSQLDAHQTRHHNHRAHRQNQSTFLSGERQFPTSGASSSSSTASPPLLMQRTNYELVANTSQQQQQQQEQEYYPMKVSPCKTGTTIITNGSSSTNGSSALLLPPAGGSLNASHQHNQANSIYDSNTITSCAPDNEQHLNQILLHQQQPQFACSQLNCQANKFATLAREAPACQLSQANIQCNNQAQQQAHFKTLPHNQNMRPLSTFLPNSNALNLQNSTACTFSHPNACNGTTNGSEYLQQQQQLVADQQQQIYSKLRLLQHYNAAVAAASDYNVTMCQQEPLLNSNGRLTNDQEVSLLGQTYNGELNNLVQQQQQQQATTSALDSQQQPNGQQAAQNGEQDDYALPFPPRWV